MPGAWLSWQLRHQPFICPSCRLRLSSNSISSTRGSTQSIWSGNAPALGRRLSLWGRAAKLPRLISRQSARRLSASAPLHDDTRKGAVAKTTSFGAFAKRSCGPGAFAKQGAGSPSLGQLGGSLASNAASGSPTSDGLLPHERELRDFMAKQKAAQFQAPPPVPAAASKPAAQPPTSPHATQRVARPAVKKSNFSRGPSRFELRPANTAVQETSPNPRPASLQAASPWEVLSPWTAGRQQPTQSTPTVASGLQSGPDGGRRQQQQQQQQPSPPPPTPKSPTASRQQPDQSTPFAASDLGSRLDGGQKRQQQQPPTPTQLDTIRQHLVQSKPSTASGLGSRLDEGQKRQQQRQQQQQQQPTPKQPGASRQQPVQSKPSAASDLGSRLDGGQKRQQQKQQKPPPLASPSWTARGQQPAQSAQFDASHLGSRPDGGQQQKPVQEITPATLPPMPQATGKQRPAQSSSPAAQAPRRAGAFSNLNVNVPKAQSPEDRYRQQVLQGLNNMSMPQVEQRSQVVAEAVPPERPRDTKVPVASATQPVSNKPKGAFGGGAFSHFKGDVELSPQMHDNSQIIRRLGWESPTQVPEGVQKSKTPEHPQGLSSNPAIAFQPAPGKPKRSIGAGAFSHLKADAEQPPQKSDVHQWTHPFGWEAFSPRTQAPTGYSPASAAHSATTNQSTSDQPRWSLRPGAFSHLRNDIEPQPQKSGNDEMTRALGWDALQRKTEAPAEYSEDSVPRPTTPTQPAFDNTGEGFWKQFEKQASDLRRAEANERRAEERRKDKGPGEKTPESRTKSSSKKKKPRNKRPQLDEDDLDDDIAEKIEMQRRLKAEKAEMRRLAAEKPPVKTIFIPEFINLHDLAKALRRPINSFLKDLEDMGFENITTDTIMTGETAGLVAAEYEFEATVDTGVKKDLRSRPIAEDVSLLPIRPPVVTIMGHVDHGKTTLLDRLRQSSVALQEHGGITQHIGAFVVKMSSGKPITFLDTPGHAAFLSMRQRGAYVTDIVVLVVAADDSVMPQTLEALKHAENAKVPIIVAINKVDKPQARVDQVLRDLAKHNVQLEEFGGDVQAVRVSGKTGEGMDDLVDNIITLSEILDVRAEVDGLAEGWIIESSIKPTGKSATILVKRGTLRPGDVVVAGKTWARVRLMLDDAGAEVAEAPPGTPVEVLGWRELPPAGELVLQAPDGDKAKMAADYRLEMAERAESSLQLAEHEQRLRDLAAKKVAEEAAAEEAKKAGLDPAEAAPPTEPAEPGVTYQNLIIRADVIGSVEAVSGLVLELGNNEVRPRVLRSAAGKVSEFDVDQAAASNAMIISFNQVLLPHIRMRAEAAKVRILEHNVIYSIADDVTTVLEDLLPLKITHRVLGDLEVQQVFPINIRKRIIRNIAGCRVRNGNVTKTSKVKVLRKAEVLFEGKSDLFVCNLMETLSNATFLQES
ncbi:hypothetical protein CDD80_7197 [Ophiocordyceps camponoti-rufipedis]|uniref:Translation initiation factor IF-2, mitochondrial n=1 Tax=Ophiocordyceps camponoti-rufipedis TaxID=2004952 RepID=A0A2C5XDW8_9HYPO|nr:hypothetical protein CDD80_7197 [Ophiocordyceps camponoti-rufipedis]